MSKENVVDEDSEIHVAINLGCEMIAREEFDDALLHFQHVLDRIMTGDEITTFVPHIYFNMGLACAALEENEV